VAPSLLRKIFPSLSLVQGSGKFEEMVVEWFDPSGSEFFLLPWREKARMTGHNRHPHLQSSPVQGEEKESLRSPHFESGRQIQKTSA
jgi:hypothetical protein